MIQNVFSQSQADFYREFLMGRKVIDPQKYGIDMTREAFICEMNEVFASVYQGQISVDELLLRPREAFHFCDDIRQRFHYHDLPDDIILRALMAPRKNPDELDNTSGPISDSQ